MTQDTSTLQDLMQQAVLTHQQEEEKKRQKEQEGKDREERKNEQALFFLLQRAIAPEFFESVTIQYRHEYVYRNDLNCVAYFPFTDEHWNIVLWDGKWRIYTSDLKNYRNRNTTKAENIPTEQLQTRLLIEMAKRQKEVTQEEETWRKHDEYLKEQEQKRLRQQEEQRIENERIEREQAEQRAKTQAEYEARKAKAQAEAKAEHDRLTVKWEEARKKALQELWRWPEGRIRDIYELQYCQAAYNDRNPGEDEQNAEFGYGEGWTATYELDRGNWITLQPTSAYESYGEHTQKETTPRSIRLMPSVHYPIWTRHTITCIEDLPGILRHKVKFTVPGIAFTRDDLCENGEYRLIERDPEEDLDYEEHGAYWNSEIIGETPVKWIRDLADQAEEQE